MNPILATILTLTFSFSAPLRANTQSWSEQHLAHAIVEHANSVSANKSITLPAPCELKDATVVDRLLTGKAFDGNVCAVLMAAYQQPQKLLPILNQWQIAEHPLLHKPSIRIIYASLLLKAHNYPECLRQLSTAATKRPHLKEHYQEVQRIYARDQKGAGKVGLKQHL